MSSITLPTPSDYLESTATPWGASRFAVAASCLKAHELGYVRQLRRSRPPVDEFGLEVEPEDIRDPSKPDPLALGSLIHAARHWEQAGRGTWDPILEAAAQDPARFSPATCAEAMRLLVAYDAHHGTENFGWPQGWRVLASECLWETELGGLPYTARADAVLELHDGSIAVVDIKTRASAPPADAEAHWKLRPQFLGLSYLAQLHLNLGAPPYTLVDAWVKTKIPKFSRILVRHSAADVLRWRDNQAKVSAALKAHMASGRPAPENHFACSPDMGSPCRFRGSCHGSEEARSLWKEDPAP